MKFVSRIVLAALATCAALALSGGAAAASQAGTAGGGTEWQQPIEWP
ncbi:MULTISPECIES: hypothetical protein [Streptomyces]|nr:MULTISPECIES: hypothetical protein [Streptomyces]GGU01289.1 hypothetical protein GCM10010272_52800 [Streptomyces lateritius]